MMILMMYAYYDRKNKSWDTPFFTFNDLYAQRKYKMDTTQENSILNEFKEDFELYRLGFFNKEEGIFELHVDKKGENILIVDNNGNFIQEEGYDAFSDETQVLRGSLGVDAEVNVQQNTRV